MLDEDPVMQVRMAYADTGGNPFHDDQRCLTFLTSRWMDLEEAIEALGVIGPYNAFDPGDVAEMLREIDGRVDGARFAVGREGSPAIYVEADDPDAVEDVFGPRRYEIDPEDRPDPDDVFSPSHPDELGRYDTPGSSYSREKFAEGEDAHTMCLHDEPPVEVDEWVEGNGRPIVRAWWD